MLSRAAAATLQQLKKYYPVIAVTGPRQSGKTTLVRDSFPDKPYVNLEEPDIRDFAASDARGFLSQFPKGAILDEVQRVPDLFSYLQVLVDENKTPGEFVLTGSQQFALRSNAAQTLAGRIGYLHLLPFSYGEMRGLPAAKSLESLLWTGGYPPIHDRKIPASLWLRDYVATYVERDVRQLVNVRDLTSFQRFVRMCAARVSQILNLSALAADCGITHNTAKAWLSILEASYLVFTLPSWHRNLGKRLVKSPKLYFYDTGLAAWLAGVENAQSLVHSAMRGPLFECWVMSEVMKHRFNYLRDAQCHYFRDSNGKEIDLVLELGSKTTAIELKSGTTVAGDWFKTLHTFKASAIVGETMLIYGGDRNFTREEIKIVGWKSIDDALRTAMG